jgi:hypothetical protein
VAVLLAFLSPTIADRLALLHPSCEDPRGLRLIQERELALAGPSMGDFTPGSAYDGSTGSLWVPPVRKGRTSRDPGDFDYLVRRSTLELRFRDGDAHDVRLICVVNGLANSSWNYENWGRVRTVAVRTSVNGHPAISNLRSLGREGFADLQPLAVPAEDASRLRIQLLDYHHGQYVELPRGVCDEDEPPPEDSGGCIRPPQARAGLAEVQVFEWPSGRPMWLAVLIGLPRIKSGL